MPDGTFSSKVLTAESGLPVDAEEYEMMKRASPIADQYDRLWQQEHSAKQRQATIIQYLDKDNKTREDDIGALMENMKLQDHPDVGRKVKYAEKLDGVTWKFGDITAIDSRTHREEVHLEESNRTLWVRMNRLRLIDEKDGSEKEMLGGTVGQESMTQSATSSSINDFLKKAGVMP